MHKSNLKVVAVAGAIVLGCITHAVADDGQNESGWPVANGHPSDESRELDAKLEKIETVVVIYAENRSFTL